MSDATSVVPPNPLDERFDLVDGDVHLSGLQALVRLAFDQRRLDLRRGLDTSVFISGYEGSPLAGFDIQLAKQSQRLEQHRVVFKPAVNEELAANAVQGSQLASASPDLIGDGVVGMWYGKAPGFDRATDAIRHSNLGGTDRRGGVLALVGDDSIAKSSTVPSSSEPAIAELGMPCLSPADPQDILDLGLHGIAMSRACGLWVALKLATNVVDGSGVVHLDSGRVDPVHPNRSFGGKDFVHEVTGSLLQPVLGRLERSQVRERIELARRYAAANHLDTIVGDPEATIGVVCAGATYLDVRQALLDMGVSETTIASSGVRVLKLGMIHPLEPGIITSFAQGLTEIVVVEEKKAFIELALKDLLYGTEGAPQVYGKRDENGSELFRADGDIPSHVIAERLAPRLHRHGGQATVAAWIERHRSTRRAPTFLPILPRTPYFCSGCPHSSSTRVPDGSLVGAGIGCHGMITFFPEERVGASIGLAAMGGEGAAWIGMSPFVDRDHLFQNLGDGTFHHSGSLAIRGAIAAGSHITYKLLYNDTVAMTGGQDAVGKMGIPQITSELTAEGVARIVVTSDNPKASRRAFGRRLPKGVTVHHRDELIAVQEQLAATPGVTVLIHDQECATELRRKRKRGLVESPKQRIMINERVCEGCGDCGDKSNCLSVQPIETEFGRKTQIHQASCNLDFSCIKGDCPSFVEVVPGTRKVSKRRTDKPPKRIRGRGEIESASLPDPVRVVSQDDFTMRITGVGGTGVVTVAQVLTAAATHAGLEVAGLDQLGLAQKGGAVVSDVRISTTKIVGANKVGPGGCDLYLGCDVLVAASQQNLAVMSPDRTFAVVSTSVTPTGQMVTDTRTSFPAEQELIDRIEWGGSRPENVFVDARTIVDQALGNDQYANIFLLGVAVQVGALPVDPEDLEWALELNGVKIAENKQAFRLGRQYVTDQDSAAAASATATSSHVLDVRAAKIVSLLDAPADSLLSELVGRRVAELVAYQGSSYARRYARLVQTVRSAEARALDGATNITEEYARQLFKLMAYKDEYEVARLQLLPEFEDQLREEFGDGARYSFLLHPPVLRALGLKRKIHLHAWWAKRVLGALYMMRPVRGTWFDPFRHAEVRRAERKLRDDYIRAVETASSSLSRDNAETVRALVALPEWVRGYEHIKLRSIEAHYQQQETLLAQLASTELARS